MLRVAIARDDGTYRVVQIPAVALPPEWVETPQVLVRLTPAEKETLAIYRQALADIESSEGLAKDSEARIEPLRNEHPDWTRHQVHAEAFESSNRDWWKRNAAIVPLLRQAHHLHFARARMRRLIVEPRKV